MERYYDNGLALWGLKCGERRITEPIFLEVFDIKGELAAVRYEDGNTGIVNSEGECVKRFPKLDEMEFVENDFVKLTDHGQVLLMDMRSQLLYTNMPESRFYGEYELLFVSEWIYTRTKRPYGVDERCGCPPVVHEDGLYLTMACDEVSMTEHLQDHDKEDEPWLEQLEKWVNSISGRACLVAGDDTQAYWLYRRLADGTIVIIDNALRFYHVTGMRDEDGKQKAVKRLVAQANEQTEEEEIERQLQPITRAAEERYAELKRKRMEAEEEKRRERLKQMIGATPYKMGNKWGLKVAERIVVPPLYRAVKVPVGKYCAVEKNYQQWGVIALDGRMVVEPKYEDVEIFEDGTAELTVFKGKKIRMRMKDWK